MNKLNFQSKNTGDTLQATEWNTVVTKVDEIVDSINNGGSSSGSGLPVAIDTSGVVSVNSKNNTVIASSKHINLEPAFVSDGGSGTYGDIQLKPGDDITLESHHRAASKRDEITIKTSNGESDALKAPVKLQFITADMTLSTKGKIGNDSNVMNVNVTTGEGKGYLKVRAQAIDLRCELHGGIALQPMGSDGQNHMNKIKFEHGGGDGLEFATFNAEKTSIFTDEYRFNKNGIWKMATRTLLDNTKDLPGTQGVDVGNGKYVPGTSDDTQHYSYKKAADDFYDNISQSDETCTTENIIRTAYALNNSKNRHTKITKKGNIEIATEKTYVLHLTTAPESPAPEATLISTISSKINGLTSVTDGLTFNMGDFSKAPSASTVYTNSTLYFTFTEVAAPAINIESGSTLKLGGVLDFGSNFSFGETDEGIEVQYKFTKKNVTKDCGVINVMGYNNSTSLDLTVEGVTIQAKNSDDDPANTALIASCSILDIIKLVNYMKTNNQGPWASQA